MAGGTGREGRWRGRPGGAAGRVAQRRTAEFGDELLLQRDERFGCAAADAYLGPASCGGGGGGGGGGGDDGGGGGFGLARW